MTLQELDTARYEALVKLAKATCAYEATVDAGYRDSSCFMVAWLDDLEEEYVKLYQRRQALIDGDYWREEEDAA